MKKFMLAALVVSVMSHGAYAQLVITEVQSNSQHPSGAGDGDWWELTNFGGASVDLTGYYWDDNGPSGADGAEFPSISIGAGERIIILDETSAAVPFWQAAWGTSATVYAQDVFGGPDTFSGLSSGGDQIELWDSDPNAGPANLVASVVFPAASGTGATFEWNSLGNSLGGSVVGENGAYMALNDGAGVPGPGIDVGSPGQAIVPEPTCLVLTGLGLIGVLGIRRK